MRLVELVQMLSQCQSLTGIIDLVKSAARELANADGTTFILREGDQCHYVDEDALGPLFKGKHFPASICVSGAAMEAGEAIIIPEGGDISIQAYCEENHSVIAVSDNGIGIAEEFLPKVFDLFTQEDTGLSRAYAFGMFISNCKCPRVCKKP